MVPSIALQCPAGTLIGHDTGEIHAFYSVPYRTTVHDFEQPELLRDAGTIDARTPGARDATLSVSKPSWATPGDDLPVVVYIHGGRYESGNHDAEGYRGESFARSGCVYVSVGYRLRFEGFARFADEIPGQYRGVQDCLTALEWLQHNIESFGGHPGNITLMGQSAGAAIALWLARRDHYRGAFHRIVALSPGYPRQGFPQRAWALGTRRSTSALAALPPKQRDRTYRVFRSFYLNDMAVGPFPYEPEELVNIPILLSNTREEMYLEPTAQFFDKAGLSQVVVRTQGKQLGCEDPKRYYQALTELDPKRICGRLVGDSTIRRWVSDTAEHAAGTVWLMEFTGTPELPASHCVDLPLVFHNLTVNPERVKLLLGSRAAEEKAELADWVHGVVVAFANGTDPAWEPFSHRRTCQTISLDGEFATAHDPLAIVRETFRTARTKSQG